MIPLMVPYVLLTLGLTGNIALFLTLKWDIQRQARKQRQSLEQITEKFELAAARTPAPEPQSVAAIPALRSGFNLSKRFQAMRMLRRGEEVAHIAAALGVSHREVELLIRVQAIGVAAIAKHVAGAAVAEPGASIP